MLNHSAIIKELKKHFDLKKIFYFAIFSFIFLFYGYLSYNNALSERFGDEVGHWVGGHFILEGKKPYSDLQFNHQPLNYYFSAITEFVTNPDNLYVYISRQRLAIFIYSFIWNVLFYVFFGVPAVLFTLIFEFIKYELQGHKLLGETLGIYPTIFIVGCFIRNSLFKLKLSSLELILISVSSFIAVFSLLPLWLVVVPVVIGIVYRSEHADKYKLIVIPFFLLTTTLFVFISPSALYIETVYNNYQYFIPASAPTQPSTLDVLLTPYYALTPPWSLLDVTISLIFISFLVKGYLFYKQEKLGIWVFLFAILILSNPRSGGEGYFGFHLLPWLGLLLIYEVFLSYYYLKTNTQRISKIFFGLHIIYAVIFISYIVNQKDIWLKKDLSDEFFVNYSKSETYGRAVRTLKDRDDTLIVAPNDPLVYLVAEVDTHVRILEFYSWLIHIEEYQNEVLGVNNSEVPDFFVFSGEGLEKSIISFIMDNYSQLYYMGKPSELYIHKEKMAEISEPEWQELKTQFFTRP